MRHCIMRIRLSNRWINIFDLIFLEKLFNEIGEDELYEKRRKKYFCGCTQAQTKTSLHSHNIHAHTQTQTQTHTHTHTYTHTVHTTHDAHSTHKVDAAEKLAIKGRKLQCTRQSNITIGVLRKRSRTPSAFNGPRTFRGGSEAGRQGCVCKVHLVLQRSHAVGAHGKVDF